MSSKSNDSTATATELWQVELQVCVGMEQPIPVPGFPKLPRYQSLRIAPPLSKRKASQLMKHLVGLNPGYLFAICKAKGGAR